MKKIFLITFTILFLCSPVWAATYYVRTDGHDTNCAGTHDASDASTETDQCAWLTIGKAESSLSGTNTVIVASGEYTENVTINVNGTDASNLLTFQSQSALGAQINGVIVISGNYVKFDGFKIVKQDEQETTVTITGSTNTFSNNSLSLKASYTPPANTNYGLNLAGSSNTADSNYITDGCQGAAISGSDNIFTNNEIDHLKMYAPSCGDVDYVRIFGSGHYVADNYFHGSLAEEIGDAHMDGFQSFDNAGQTIANCTFERNIIYDTHNSCWILSMTVNKSTDNTGNIIRNNVCHSKGNWGIDARNCGYEAYNNTIVIDGSSYFLYQSESQGAAHYVKAQNNIMVCTNNEVCSPTSYGCTQGTMGVECKNNLSYAVYDNDRYSAETFSSDIVNQDPKFINLPTNDLTLQSSSPAINAGVTVSGFSDDVLGTSRPQGAAWDIGAYEYYETGNIRGITASGVTMQ